MGRKQYTEEEKAEFRAANDAICDGGEQLLSDPDAVAAMITELSRLTSPKLLRYSLRNVAILFSQAEERGMTLTDVEGGGGWRMRGRAVKEDQRWHPLRIVAPKGREKRSNKDGQEPIKLPDAPAEDGNAEDKTRFRMIPVFDISQTEGIEDFDGEPLEVEPIADPATAVRLHLVEQLDRIGYTVTTGEAEGIDDDARTVTVSETQPLEQLAQALAELITRPADERPRPTRAAAGGAVTVDPHVPPSITLDLGEFGTGRAVADIDHGRGRVYYRVNGPSVRGTFTVGFYEPAKHPEPTRADIKYGRDEREGPRAYGNVGQERGDRPTVNGIRLVDSSTVSLAEVETFNSLYVPRLSGRYDNNTMQVPDRTADRARAVVRALLRHFTNLPEFGELFARAAALQAPTLQREKDAEARKLADRIAALQAEQAEALDRSRHYADLAAADVAKVPGTQLEVYTGS